MRRCEEPPPGPTGRCSRPRLYDTCRLDVWGRRVAGHLTSGDRRNIRTTAWPPDQRRCGLLLLLVVIGDPNEPTALGCSPPAAPPQGTDPSPVAFSPLLCPRWSGRDGSAPPRCWCIEDTKQRRPLVGPSPQDSPYQVLVTRTLRTGQSLQSTEEPTTSHQLGGQVLKKQY